MKLSAVCIFAIVALASAASIPQYDGPTYELKRITERDAYPEGYPGADPEGYPAADPEGYPAAYANAVGNAAAEPDPYAVANALANAASDAAGQLDSNGVALADDDYNRPRRFTCNVLRWFNVGNAACSMRCRVQRRKGGRCQNGVCICR
ncbi:defensin-2-like [Augochlora pura]